MAVYFPLPWQKQLLGAAFLLSGLILGQNGLLGGENSPQAGTSVPTVFCVHPQNHRCFLYRGKAIKLLTSGEHYGAVLNGDFDYGPYLDELARHGLNLTRTFTFYRELPHSIPEPGTANTLAPRAEAAVLPWLRAPGHGRAADGLDKFDLDQWNDAYFARFKDFVRECGKRGVICEVVLFSRPYQADRYDLLPLSKASNINQVGEKVASHWQYLLASDAGLTAAQERFVRKIVTELNEFDNLYYEICNEPKAPPDRAAAYENDIVAWHLRMVDAIRRQESMLPKRHLVAVNSHQGIPSGIREGGPFIRHEDPHYVDQSAIDILNYHYLSSKADAQGFFFHHLANEGGRAGHITRFLRQRDAVGKPIVFDETFSGIVRRLPERYPVNRAEAWETLLAGGAGYDNLDWSFTPSDETGSGKSPIADGRRLDGRPLRKWFGVLARTLARFDVATLKPADGIVRCQVPPCFAVAAADNQGRYVVYIVDEAVYQRAECRRHEGMSLSLALPVGRYRVQTINPTTGSLSPVVEHTSDGTVDVALWPFTEDTAVLVELIEP